MGLSENFFSGERLSIYICFNLIGYPKIRDVIKKTYPTCCFLTPTTTVMGANFSLCGECHLSLCGNAEASLSDQVTSPASASAATKSASVAPSVAAQHPDGTDIGSGAQGPEDSNEVKSTTPTQTLHWEAPEQSSQATLHSLQAAHWGRIEHFTVVADPLDRLASAHPSGRAVALRPSPDTHRLCLVNRSTPLYFLKQRSHRVTRASSHAFDASRGPSAASQDAWTHGAGGVQHSPDHAHRRSAHRLVLLEDWVSAEDFRWLRVLFFHALSDGQWSRFGALSRLHNQPLHCFTLPLKVPVNSQNDYTIIGAMLIATPYFETNVQQFLLAPPTQRTDALRQESLLPTDTHADVVAEKNGGTAASDATSRLPRLPRLRDVAHRILVDREDTSYASVVETDNPADSPGRLSVHSDAPAQRTDWSAARLFVHRELAHSAPVTPRRKSPDHHAESQRGPLTHIASSEVQTLYHDRVPSPSFRCTSHTSSSDGKTEHGSYGEERADSVVSAASMSSLTGFDDLEYGTGYDTLRLKARADLAAIKKRVSTRENE